MLVRMHARKELMEESEAKPGSSWALPAFSSPGSIQIRFCPVGLEDVVQEE